MDKPHIAEHPLESDKPVVHASAVVVVVVVVAPHVIGKHRRDIRTVVIAVPVVVVVEDDAVLADVAVHRIVVGNVHVVRVAVVVEIIIRALVEGLLIVVHIVHLVHIIAHIVNVVHVVHVVHVVRVWVVGRVAVVVGVVVPGTDFPMTFRLYFGQSIANRAK